MVQSQGMAGLYVHIPFCSIKCYYCDFTAFAGQGRQTARYLESLEVEARNAPRLEFKTLYIGGGTPSELQAPDLRGLFSRLKNGLGNWPVWEEATFEANPESLSVEKIRILRDNGITRVSLGLQTTDNDILQRIGRKHTFEQFLEVFSNARGAGFDVNVDLIFGLPGQSVLSLETSLQAVLDLEPEHLSVYGLQVEYRTLFNKRGVDPDEDEGREMFELVLEKTARAGYRHYEISNFSKPGKQSKHNLLYWTGKEYVGLGCGAASFVGGERWSNEDRLKPYCDGILSGAGAKAEAERLAGKEACGERLLLGLRLPAGMALDREAEETFAGEWRELETQGLVERRGPSVRLTREGLFLSNRVFQKFVAPFEVPA